ncbi:MAG: hypothetical protein KHY56_01785 [Veillonella sp.]|nr:hypothetical protein [Veillonella sp.]
MIKNILYETLNNIRMFLLFFKRCPEVGFYKAYREYIYSKVMGLPNFELKYIYEVLISNIQSKLLFIFSTIFLGAILTSMIGVGVSLSFEILKPNFSEDIFISYNEYMRIIGLSSFVISVLGFIIITFFRVSCLESLAFYIILILFVIGVIYWANRDHTILMDLYFIVLCALSTTLMLSSIFNCIKKCAIIKKIIIEGLLAQNRKRYTVRLPKKYRVLKL